MKACFSHYLSTGLVALMITGSAMAEPPIVEKPFLAFHSESQTIELHVSGVGYWPKRGRSQAQRQLMARRAAIVDAYRNLTIVNLHSTPAHGIIHFSGFLKGAKLEQTRYDQPGKVEVEMSLRIKEGVPSFQEAQHCFMESNLPMIIIPKKNEITREEYEELFRQK